MGLLNRSEELLVYKFISHEDCVKEMIRNNKKIE